VICFLSFSRTSQLVSGPNRSVWSPKVRCGQNPRLVIPNIQNCLRTDAILDCKLCAFIFNSYIFHSPWFGLNRLHKNELAAIDFDCFLF
jgi:hypothetical protein